MTNSTPLDDFSPTEKEVIIAGGGKTDPFRSSVLVALASAADTPAKLGSHLPASAGVGAGAGAGAGLAAGEHHTSPPVGSEVERGVADGTDDCKYSPILPIQVILPAPILPLRWGVGGVGVRVNGGGAICATAEEALGCARVGDQVLEKPEDTFVSADPDPDPSADPDPDPSDDPDPADPDPGVGEMKRLTRHVPVRLGVEIDLDTLEVDQLCVVITPARSRRLHTRICMRNTTHAHAHAFTHTCIHTRALTLSHGAENFHYFYPNFSRFIFFQYLPKLMIKYQYLF